MLGRSINRCWLLIRLVRIALSIRSTRIFYDKISSMYDMVFQDHMVHVNNCATLLTNLQIEKGERTVLDLGCGTGMFSKAIVDKNFRVVGVDISLESLRIIRRARLPVSLIQSDAELLPFSECQFKVLVCLGVWRHLIHMELVLDEICRVLKKDGNFVLGYFPPKLGGLLHISENFWGRVLVNAYNHMVCRFGYGDIAGSDLERKTMQALSKRFKNVHKVDSGENWHLLLACGLRTRADHL